MSTLSIKDHEKLSLRGISAQDSPYGDGGVIITLTSTGIMWLLNYLSLSRKVGSILSVKLLKEVAKFEPEKEWWRRLIFKAVSLPVYDTDYLQFVFYLEGSPPKAFLAFLPDLTSVPHTVDIPLSECGSFRVRDDQIVSIQFSESEVGKLSNGDLIILDEDV
uniref:Uncharacterized protein n=1 Tax=Candidatus Kentrum sp. UNK TaxID=2126344 RepID=A0A451AL38_9GAMM|nr:MAG: hypothetical protein BECKUNK1418G_GA0071005_110610 [Candidatus Kentron sp. UNK]VFK72207.1 MAG: hypothetical protein BECKUNK1418H_GA0071006_110111 [Candidatus Kentron sp. UNK]